MDIKPGKSSIRCETRDEMIAVVIGLCIHGAVWQAGQYDGYWIVNVTGY